jgi:predicted unusual protein kinase regulating ubiquinone biosynthesis (AarF/ABC1/UbiB family)
MRMLWHTPWRFLLILWTLTPIYFRYLAFWLRWKWFGKPPTQEKWARAHRKSARKFYRLAVRMRGGLIKVGQIISTRVDIMPKEWCEELAGLQDRVDPTPWKAIRRRLTHELGKPPEEVFAEIATGATAAASFGQVHRAKTKDGRDVALKIQYEDVRLKLACDLFVLRCAVPLFNVFVPKVPLRNIYDEVKNALETELDYRKEAEHTRIIGANMKNVPHVVVPEVLAEYTTEHVICTTWFEGWKITDKDRLAAEGFPVLDVMQKMIRAYANMFFVDGVFQSDPHPGNLLCRRGADGTAELCILDFGQVKILPRGFQQKLILASVAFMGRDVDNFSKAVVGLGVLSERDIAIARPILQEFFEEMFEMTPQELKQLDVELVRKKIEDVLKRIEGVHIPQDLVLYGRAFSLLAGVCAALDPEVNGIIVAKPMIMEALMRPEVMMAMAAPA